MHKAVARVPDRCAICNSPLYCETCQCTPTHRPFAKQALKQLIDRMSGTWPEAFDIINAVRNGVMHGESIDEIQTKITMPFAQVADRTGILAWNAIILSISYSPGAQTLQLAATNTFIRQTLIMKVRMLLGSYGDPNNPTLENMPAPTISVQSRQRPPSDEPDRE